MKIARCFALMLRRMPRAWLSTSAPGCTSDRSSSPWTQGVPSSLRKVPQQKKLAVYSDPGYVHDDNWNLFRIGHDAHITEEAAIAHARKMIARKLASLDKQRDKLLKMEEELR